MGFEPRTTDTDAGYFDLETNQIFAINKRNHV